MSQSQQRDLCYPENPKDLLSCYWFVKSHIISIDIQNSSAGPGLIAYVIDIKDE